MSMVIKSGYLKKNCDNVLKPQIIPSVESKQCHANLDKMQ